MGFTLLHFAKTYARLMWYAKGGAIGCCAENKAYSRLMWYAMYIGVNQSVDNIKCEQCVE